jgi:hypothetical protein
MGLALGLDHLRERSQRPARWRAGSQMAIVSQVPMVAGITPAAKGRVLAVDVLAFVRGPWWSSMSRAIILTRECLRPARSAGGHTAVYLERRLG